MKVLITGGAGFIGSHVAETLVNEGHEVEILDDFSTGRMENLDGIKSSVRLVKGSILDDMLLEKQFTGINIVVHLAAQISVARSLVDPYTDAKINVLGSIRVANFCLEQGVEHLLFASSGGAIYGNPPGLPATEDTPPAPLSPYAASKLAFENYLTFYRDKGLESSIMRLGNVFGSRQDPLGEAGVISIFLENLRNEKPLVVYGDGTSSRDYLYVQDLSGLVSKLVNKPVSGCFNACSGEETRLIDMIDLMKEVTGIEPVLQYAPLRRGEVKNIYLSNHKVKKMTGWKPSISLKAGIELVWKWLNE
ncbi:MAG: NAD-dependent epimerase/dehydratase family protein [Candidatus Hodarchaeales archaeon]|jgi:UDP-glucose 4-epimerase